MGLNKCKYCSEDIPDNMARCPYCCSVLGTVAAKKNDASAQQKKFVFPKIKINMNIPEKKPAEAAVPAQAVVPDKPAVQAKNMSNYKKVLLTAITVFFPLIGQVIGILFSIVVLGYIHDPDQRSFAKALLAAAVIVFFLSCFFFMIAALIWLIVHMIR